MEITGDTRVFLVINTVNYNGDGKWAVQDSSFGNLVNLGFGEEDVERIDGLNANGVLTDFDFDGVIVVRVA